LTLLPHIYEPFTATFTGALVTLQTRAGREYRFHQPYPKVVKHTPYMLEVNPNTKQVRLLPVLMPRGGMR
jgi:hypothetical protein